ncbi:hypothetical protein ACWELP_00760 [Rhodococcus aetherivorans]
MLSLRVAIGPLVFGRSRFSYSARVRGFRSWRDANHSSAARLNVSAPARWSQVLPRRWV